MENMDQTIPFVVLVTVGLLLLLLLRRTSATETASLRSPSVRKAEGAGADQNLRAEKEAAATPIVTEVQPSAPTSMIAKPKKQRPSKPASAPLSEPTPIETVVGMLKQKNTLMAAFLLREIFDPPISRR